MGADGLGDSELDVVANIAKISFDDLISRFAKRGEDLLGHSVVHPNV